MVRRPPELYLDCTSFDNPAGWPQVSRPTMPTSIQEAFEDHVEPRDGRWTVRYVNAIAAGLQLGTALAILILILVGRADYCAPLVQRYSVYTELPGGAVTFTPAERQISCLPPAWVLFTMALITGLKHALVLLPPVFRRHYDWGTAGLNAFAWPEYAITAPMGTFTLLLLVGVNELSVLVALASYLSWVNLLGGLVPELTLWLLRRTKHGAKLVNCPAMVWLPFAVTGLMTLAPWSVFFAYYFTAVTQRPPGSDAPPLFLNISFISTFTLYFGFAAVFAAQRIAERVNWKFGRRHPYVWMIANDAFSMLEKLLLTWFLVTGVLIR